MVKESMQTDFASADPVPAGEDSKLRDLVLRVAAGVREVSMGDSPARTPWWKRSRIMIPIGIAGVAALTGAAVVIPLGLWVNGTQVDLDAEIPIEYTTNTGIAVSCRYGIYFGDPENRNTANRQLAEFVGNHDWAGIGQRIYDEAIANPFTPGPADDFEVDNQEVRDRFSFQRATDLIWNEMPSDLLESGQSAGATSDCTGQLR